MVANPAAIQRLKESLDPEQQNRWLIGKGVPVEQGRGERSLSTFMGAHVFFMKQNTWLIDMGGPT